MKKSAAVTAMVIALLATLLTAAPTQAETQAKTLTWVGPGRLNVCVALRPEAVNDSRWSELRFFAVDWRTASTENEFIVPSDVSTFVKTAEQICQDVFVEPGYRFIAAPLPILSDGLPASVGDSTDYTGWVDITTPPLDDDTEIRVEAVRTQPGGSGAADVDVGWRNAPSRSEILAYDPRLGDLSRPSYKQPVTGLSGVSAFGSSFDCGEVVEFVVGPPSDWPGPRRMDLDPYATTGAVDVICPLHVSLTAVSKQAKVRVSVDASRGNDDWPIQIQKQQTNGSYRTVKTVLTDEGSGAPETTTVTVGPGRFRAVVPAQPGYARAVSGSVLIPELKVKVQPVRARTKIKVDVDPSVGSSAWKVQIQQKKSSGTFKTIKTVWTMGSTEIKVLDVRRGNYRAVVPPQRGYNEVVSRTVFIRR